MRYSDEADRYLYRTVAAERMLCRLVQSVRDVMKSNDTTPQSPDPENG
ncbi:hypothetical protein ACIREE_38990 [Streptomyces sp. NPDC102467]